MNLGLYSKRRLFKALSWLVVALYLVLNISITTSGLTIIKTIIFLPLVNIVLIAAWFFVRSFYNNANDAIRWAESMEERPVDGPIPVYGHNDNSEYEPSLKVKDDVFNEINTKPGNEMIFDMSLKDYLKPGRVIIFHNEIDYGMTKKVKVVKANLIDEKIRVSFSDTDA